MHGREQRMSDPEEELAAKYELRARPFIDLGNTAKARQYERAWEIARTWLRRVRERNEDHAT